MRLRAACRVKGVWDAVEQTTEGMSDSCAKMAVEPRLKSKREKVSGIIISALEDTPLHVVIDADNYPKNMFRLLDALYASNSTVSLIAVQTQLYRMVNRGQNMSERINQFSSLFAQLERMDKDAAIPESHRAPMLLASIDAQCPMESTAAALRTKVCDGLTWKYLVTTLIDKYNA